MMRLHGVSCRPYRLPLVRPWRTAAGRIVERRGWLLGLHGDSGLTGWGELLPPPGDPLGEEPRLEGCLAHWQRHWPGRRVDELLAEGAREWHTPRAARAGAEMALLDLDARARGIPLYRHWAPRGTGRVALNAALGSLMAVTTDRLIRQAREYAVLKVKVGVGTVEQETRQLATFCTQVPGVRFRLDANRAWTPERAILFLERVAELPVESLEEPLARPEPDLWTALQRRVPFPLALDESLLTEAGAELSGPGVARRLVLKPTALGGLGAAWRAAQRAREGDQEVVVTTALEGSIATHAAAHLAAALGEGPPHGLATGTWLARDLAPPLPITRGWAQLPPAPGLGVEPHGEDFP